MLITVLQIYIAPESCIKETVTYNIISVKKNMRMVVTNET